MSWFGARSWGRGGTVDAVDAAAVIRRFGGVAATHELHRYGVGRARIAAAIDGGAIIRVRQGWYALRTLDSSLLGAVRVGGRATCLTALRVLGVWTPADSRLHVSVAPNAARLRSPHDSRERRAEGVVAHWNDDRTGSRLMTPVDRCIVDAADCIEPEMLTALTDSALRANPALFDALPDLLAAVPERARSAVRLADGVCESGVETLFWIRLPWLHAAIRRQVVIPDVGRVDFLIGERLVVEVDGAEHHSGSGPFERDRRRDAILSALGYRVLRFSYWQIMERWPEVEAAIRAALARGDHR